MDAMKPRCLSVPLSEEDWHIWLLVAHRFSGPFEHMTRLAFLDRAARQGRRDADLMYGIELARQWERDHPDDFTEYKDWGFVHALVSAGVEYPVRIVPVDITYCA
jgi:hypothetical protein